MSGSVRPSGGSPAAAIGLDFVLKARSLIIRRYASDKPREAGSDPSNTIDIGYPIGGINIAGDTPIILLHDCITLGGFIVPYTVPSCEFWKLAQSRPWDLLRFEFIDVKQAQAERRKIDAIFAAG